MSEVESPKTTILEKEGEGRRSTSDLGLSTVLMVGFNRRFAPHSVMAKELFGKVSDMVINCRVNAGFVPGESWVHDVSEGGGRVVGEVCHFVDLIQYLSSSLPARVFASCTKEKGEDNLVITLEMQNGSIATILYASQGDKLLPRERIEVFSGNSVCVIDNFKSFFFAKDGRSKKHKLFSLDRGYKGEFEVFFNFINPKSPKSEVLSPKSKINSPKSYVLGSKSNQVEFEDYVYTTLTTFAIIESIRTGQPQKISLEVLSQKS
jgi:polar amino acid transport system substrate-binding protein